MDIVYACEWEKNRRVTWSGISYSLLTALKRRIKVHEIDLTMNLIEKIMLSIVSLRIRNANVRIDKSCRPLTIFYKQKKLEFLLSGKNDIPRLIIGDFGKVKNGYYYTDLTVGALLYFRKYHSEIARWANLNTIPDADLQVRNKYQLQILSQAKGIFTMSKWLKEYLISQEGFLKNKIHYVGGGTNLTINYLKQEKKPGERKRILFIGRDFYRKGGDLLVAAFKILKKNLLKNAELYIVGPDKKIIENKDGIICFGDLSSEEIAKLIGKCDVFCMPSRFEAYGISFVEALTSGLPCIGRNCFEMKEFIEDGKNGYLIENDDAEALAIKMYDLLRNDEIIKYVEDMRCVYEKQYSWNTVAQKILEIIEFDMKINRI